MHRESGFLALTLPLVILINILWYWAKALLRGRGYPAVWYGGHFGDLANLWRASCAATNEGARTKLRMLLAAIIILLVGLVIVFFAVD